MNFRAGTGLLHDTIEDTFATYETIKNEFGDEVADLVNGVTKISVFENTAGSNSKVENFRKLILATSKDIRVLLVKQSEALSVVRGRGLRSASGPSPDVHPSSTNLYTEDYELSPSSGT